MTGVIVVGDVARMASQISPTEIAENLIQEHGLDGAIRAAMDAIADAHAQRDNYALSIWREVKRILNDRRNDAG